MTGGIPFTGRKDDHMPDNNQNPGRKWGNPENDGDGDKYFDTYRYTPFTTDTEFFRDPNIYEADEVARTTQDKSASPGFDIDPRPRGDRMPDERMKEEIQDLLAHHTLVDDSNIQVDVRQGVVTLTGNVDSSQEKRIAEQIARNAFGVLEVNNQILVNDEEP
jgi:hypothetical protein